jgi:hypothetical protein
VNICLYRPPGVGLNVDPLGEGLIRLFPDGFRLLFAPALALPAPLLMPPLEVTVAVPLIVDPVVVRLVAGPIAAELPAAELLPLWANANVPASVITAAKPKLENFMASFLFPGDEGQAAAPR